MDGISLSNCPWDTCTLSQLRTNFSVASQHVFVSLARPFREDMRAGGIGFVKSRKKRTMGGKGCRKGRSASGREMKSSSSIYLPPSPIAVFYLLSSFSFSCASSV
ncbi:hypothetical protein CDAR_4681 [Caerostris darwini]|uniref:Uncharacterized protein n=1 Tax=Caerostris darwini TaxID=1538125 RepID=A0AAV4P3U1_9ARAC|nr:hypothetical protein CDAR_4681 [Caerostris darwini]